MIVVTVSLYCSFLPDIERKSGNSACLLSRALGSVVTWALGIVIFRRAEMCTINNCSLFFFLLPGNRSYFSNSWECPGGPVPASDVPGVPGGFCENDVSVWGVGGLSSSPDFLGLAANLPPLLTFPFCSFYHFYLSTAPWRTQGLSACAQPTHAPGGCAPASTESSH